MDNPSICLNMISSYCLSTLTDMKHLGTEAGKQEACGPSTVNKLCLICTVLITNVKLVDGIRKSEHLLSTSRFLASFEKSENRATFL